VAGGNDHDGLDLGEMLPQAAHSCEPYEERAASWTAQPACAGESWFEVRTLVARVNQRGLRTTVHTLRPVHES